MEENVQRTAAPSLFLAGGRENVNWRANIINSFLQSGKALSTAGRQNKEMVVNFSG